MPGCFSDADDPAVFFQQLLPDKGNIIRRRSALFSQNAKVDHDIIPHGVHLERGQIIDALLFAGRFDGQRDIRSAFQACLIDREAVGIQTVDRFACDFFEQFLDPSFCMDIIKAKFIARRFFQKDTFAAGQMQLGRGLYMVFRSP